MKIYIVAIKSTYEYDYKKLPWSKKEHCKLYVYSNARPIYAKDENTAFLKYQKYIDSLDELLITANNIFDTNAETFNDAFILMRSKNTVCTSNEKVIIDKDKCTCTVTIKYLMNNLPAEDFKSWWVENNPETSNNCNNLEVLNLASSED